MPERFDTIGTTIALAALIVCVTALALRLAYEVHPVAFIAATALLAASTVHYLNTCKETTK